MEKYKELTKSDFEKLVPTKDEIQPLLVKKKKIFLFYFNFEKSFFIQIKMMNIQILNYQKKNI